MAEDRVHWWAAVNAAVRFRFHKVLIFYLLAYRLSASKERCFVDLVRG
jgi:hypothetical protein